METGLRSIEHTGERMIPEKTGPMNFWQHILRYRFATAFIRNKQVLDLACGEGYGSAGLLKSGAASVIGIDISEELCEYARKKYGIDTKQGRAEAIPLPNQSVDVVVSFETIEHIKTPEAFLDECLRVLRPNGLLIISTPNRQISEKCNTSNPFHCSELTETEFIALLRPRFRQYRLYTQTPYSAAWWSIRSFLAWRSPWLRPKGAWRMRELIWAVFCSQISGEVKDVYRQAPDRLIFQKDPLLNRTLNPYSIRKHSRWTGERPFYFIAVAEL